MGRVFCSLPPIFGRMEERKQVWRKNYCWLGLLIAVVLFPAVAGAQPSGSDSASFQGTITYAVHVSDNRQGKLFEQGLPRQHVWEFSGCCLRSSFPQPATENNPQDTLVVLIRADSGRAYIWFAQRDTYWVADIPKYQPLEIPEPEQDNRQPSRNTPAPAYTELLGHPLTLFSQKIEASQLGSRLTIHSYNATNLHWRPDSQALGAIQLPGLEHFWVGEGIPLVRQLVLERYEKLTITQQATKIDTTPPPASRFGLPPGKTRAYFRERMEIPW